MTDKELKQLSRKKLLEMLIELESENERLRAELAQAQSNIAAESIILDKSHPFSEVAVKVNAIFKAADEAAKQYLDNLRLAAERQQGQSGITSPVQPSADTQVPPSFTAPVQPSFDTQVPPSFTAPAQPSFDTQVPPSFTAPAQPSFDTQVPPSFTAPAQPSFDTQVPPSFTAPVQPSFDTQVPPSFTAPAQPSFDTQAPPSYTAPAQPSFDTQVPPSYTAPVQPSFTPTAQQPAFAPWGQPAYQPLPQPQAAAGTPVGSFSVPQAQPDTEVGFNFDNAFPDDVFPDGDNE